MAYFCYRQHYPSLFDVEGVWITPVWHLKALLKTGQKRLKARMVPLYLLAIDICILAAWGLYLPRILKNWWPVLVYVQGQVHIHTCRGTQCSHWQRGQHTVHQVGKGLIIMYEVCMKMKRHGSEDDPFKRVISHKLLASSQCAAAEDWLPVSCDLVYD